MAPAGGIRAPPGTCSCICMKFYEYILNSFKVIERTRFCQETATVQSDETQKVSIQELWFLHSAPNVG